MNKCNVCNDDFWIAHGCCSGAFCGCMGMPTEVVVCSSCNKDGKKEPSEDFKMNIPFWDKLEYIEPNNNPYN